MGKSIENRDGIFKHVWGELIWSVVPTAVWFSARFIRACFISKEFPDISILKNPIYESVVIFFFSYTVKLSFERAKEIQRGSNDIKRLLDELRQKEIVTVTHSHLSEKEQFLDFVSDHISLMETKGGGNVILNITNSKDYLDILKSAFACAKESVHSTLTCINEAEEKYYPSWFFKNDCDAEGRVIADHRDKIEYLKLVNKHAKKIEATRLMVFDFSSLKKSFDTMKPEEILIFFTFHSNVNLYYLQPGKVQDINLKSLVEIIKHDFVMFDEYLIIKRGRAKVSLMSTHINRFYKELFNDDNFRHKFEIEAWDKEKIIQEFKLLDGFNVSQIKSLEKALKIKFR